MDVSTLKVADLHRELRRRALPTTGDKAELAARLRLALQEAALDEELDLDVLDGPAAPATTLLDAADAELASPPTPTLVSSSTPEPVTAKKIVLNRTPAPLPIQIDVPAAETPELQLPTVEAPISSKELKSVKLTVDSKTRLEMRAKRFGLVPQTNATNEARKAKFELAAPVDSSLDVLKKRAERFGSSVSKLMVDMENKEKLEKRKAKFGTVSS